MKKYIDSPTNVKRFRDRLAFPLTPRTPGRMLAASWEARMAFTIHTIEYFRATVKDEPGEGFALLSALASAGVDLVGFTAVPHGTAETQLTLFPESASALARAAASIGIPLDGPHHAILVQGDNELGAAAEIHRVLAHAGLNVASSTGLADTCGSFGYIIHLREADIAPAAHVLAEAFTAARV